jgi:hypothetical protein
MIELAESDRSRAYAGQGVDHGSLKFDRERLAVIPCFLALPGRLLPVPAACFAILGCEQAVAGCLRAVLCGALALLGGLGHDFDAAECPCALLPPGRRVELGHRQVPGVSGLVAGESRKISEVRDRVALLGDPQTLTCGLRALRGGALTDATAEFVSCPIDTGCEIVIAGGLVAVGGDLVALRAGLIAFRGAVTSDRERLVSLACGLIALGQRPLAVAGKR